jgi:hypothetical protein
MYFHHVTYLNVSENGSIDIGITFIDSTYINGVGLLDDPYANEFTWSSIILNYLPNGDFNYYDHLVGTCEKLILDFTRYGNLKKIVIAAGVPDVNNPNTCFLSYLNNTFYINSIRNTLILTFDNNDSLINDNIITKSGSNKITNINNSNYVTGSSITNFGSNSFDSTYFLNHNPEIENRAFLAKYDSTSTVVWVKCFGNNGWDSHVYFSDIIPSGDNIVIAGVSFTQSVSNQIFFENASTLNGNSWGDDDFFVVYYDNLGNVKWHSISKSEGREHITEITTDSNNNIYATGTFNSPLFFAGDTLIPFGSEDVFVICYDSLGAEKWAINAAGASLDQAHSIDIDLNGTLYISGSTLSSTAIFGNISYSLSGSDAQLFLAKVDSSSYLNTIQITSSEQIIQLYPNPNDGAFVIDSKNEVISELNIYNMLGAKVYNVQGESNTIHVNLEHLPKGTFLVELKLKDERLVQNKFIVNK